MSLARTRFTSELVRWLILKQLQGHFGEHIDRARKYAVKRLHSSFSWRVRSGDPRVSVQAQGGDGKTTTVPASNDGASTVIGL